VFADGFNPEETLIKKQDFSDLQRVVRLTKIASGIPLLLLLLSGTPLFAEASRALPDPYYPQRPTGELRLNYYYDRTGRWVKFSDWIPFKKMKYEPQFFEDFYELYGLPHHYRTDDVKEGIYFLVQAQTHKFRHPRNSLCKIESEERYHKYRNLMFMQVNYLIMRMYLRLGSMYDKRHLYFHDLDFSDDLEISFMIARTYYGEAKKYWELAKHYAIEANRHPFEIDLPTIETTRYDIIRGELDFDRIIGLHLGRVESKLGAVKEFLDEEGRPRPVKSAIQKDIEAMYDGSFTSSPLDTPVLDPEWKEKPLFETVE
jgi:hypothetical protein